MPRYKVVDCGSGYYGVMDTKLIRVYPFTSHKVEEVARDFNRRGYATAPALMGGRYIYCTPRNRICGAYTACPLLKLKPKKEVKMARTKKKKSGCK